MFKTDGVGRIYLPEKNVPDDQAMFVRVAGHYPAVVVAHRVYFWGAIITADHLMADLQGYLQRVLCGQTQYTLKY